MTAADAPGLLAALDGGPGDRAALLLTTNPGLEDLVAAELTQRLGPLAGGPMACQQRPLGFGGHVLALGPCGGGDLSAAALTLRCVHHVIQPLYGFDLPAGGSGALDRIHGELLQRGIPRLEAPGVRTFRITTKRSGVHPFTSIDVQRRAGAAVVARYGLAVSLLDFDCEVRVDVTGRRCLVGVQLTRLPLSRRHHKPYNPRAALKANVAYALLRLAGVDRGRLLDPFCGSATIPLEAAAAYPGLQVEASDASPAAVEGARANLAAAGHAEAIPVFCRDLSDLPDAYPAGTFDAIVTNPPYGVRLGLGMDYVPFYRRFLDVSAHLLAPGGRLVFLAWKRGVVDLANRSARHGPRRPLRRVHVRVVETGGIYPRIYVMERR